MAAMAPEAQLAQMANELAVARAQIMRISAEQDSLRAQAQQAVAASEARLLQVIAQSAQTQSRGDDTLNIVDFKTAQPEAFKGRREESWKTWSRGFKTYCNIKKQGFRQALEWAENFPGDTIDGDALDSMQWGPARLADSKLFDFLSIICKDDAHMLVDQFDGMGFEAWWQLSAAIVLAGGSSSWT